jgi:hypothetical protein
VWYTIYRVKGEDKKRNLNEQILKVATLQLERKIPWRTLLSQKVQTL